MVSCLEVFLYPPCTHAHNCKVGVTAASVMAGMTLRQPELEQQRGSGSDGGFKPQAEVQAQFKNNPQLAKYILVGLDLPPS